MARRTRQAPDGTLLLHNNYGKSRVRMVKVSRKGRVHTVREFTVDVALKGDFDDIHTRGDNRKCLPTDTMKNTVYALGRKHPISSIESFAMRLAEHFHSSNRHVERARVRIQETAWERLNSHEKPHPHCFIRGGEERQTCRVLHAHEGPYISGGIESLTILKSTDSAFSGFMRDKYTTLKPTRDRIFATSLNAEWNYLSDPERPARIDFGACRSAIRGALIQTFADHKSESVQHTLHAMGEAALRTCKAIHSIHISMPNKHCLLVDLSPFGMTNPNEVFVPTDEPHGLIEATIVR